MERAKTIIWSPAEPPPHPRTVSGFSVQAERIWETILLKYKNKITSRKQAVKSSDAGYYRTLYEGAFGAPIPESSFPQAISATQQNSHMHETNSACNESTDLIVCSFDLKSANSMLTPSTASSIYDQSTTDSLGDGELKTYSAIDFQASYRPASTCPTRSVSCHQVNSCLAAFDSGSTQAADDTCASFDLLASQSSLSRIEPQCSRPKCSPLPSPLPHHQLATGSRYPLATDHLAPSPPLDLSPSHESYHILTQPLREKVEVVDSNRDVKNQNTGHREHHVQEAGSTETNLCSNTSQTAPRTTNAHRNPIANAASRISQELPRVKDSLVKRRKVGEVLDQATGTSKQRRIATFFTPYKENSSDAVRDKSNITGSTDDAQERACSLVRVAALDAGARAGMTAALGKAEEAALTLLYSDHSTQLREQPVPSKKRKEDNTCLDQVEGLVVAYTTLEVQRTAPRSYSVVLFDLSNINSQPHDTYTFIRDTIELLMRSEARKLCFDAQEMIFILINLFHFNKRKVCREWRLFDPKIAQWLLDPDKPPVTFRDLLSQYGMKEKAGDWEEEVCEDLGLLARAMSSVAERLREEELWWLYEHVETPIIPQLACMEAASIKVVVEEMVHSAKVLGERLGALEQAAHVAAGQTFNINSHAQLRMILFEKLKLDCKLPKRRSTTSQGNKSTSEAVLTQLQNTHALPGIVLQHRQVQKLKSTYVDGLLACVRDGLLSTHWDHTAAATGRLTSCNPNIQSVPKLPLKLPPVAHPCLADQHVPATQIYARAPIISREGYSLLAADFRQIELRMLAHLSQAAGLLSLFNDHTSGDVFTDLASKWQGKAAAEVTVADREQTKRVVYSVMYGVGKDRLSSYLNTSAEHAQAVIHSFLVTFPGVSAFTRRCVAEAREQGYQVSMLGRRRLLPHIQHASHQLRAQAERQAVNFCIQGSAADLCKLAMVRVEEVLSAQQLEDVTLLYQIHDELLFEVPDPLLTRTAQLVRGVMEDSAGLCGERVHLRVPLCVSVSAAKSWAHLRPV